LSCGVFSSSYAYFTYFSSEMGMNDASSWSTSFDLSENWRI
jgi:hypothetical protein